jgi:hypothetical protein
MATPCSIDNDHATQVVFSSLEVYMIAIIFIFVASKSSQVLSIFHLVSMACSKNTQGGNSLRNMKCKYTHLVVAGTETKAKYSMLGRRTTQLTLELLAEINGEHQTLA